MELTNRQKRLEQYELKNLHGEMLENEIIK